MKKLSAIITAAALFIIIWACSDYENTNPFHPDSENIVPLQNLTLQPQKVDHIQVIWDSDYLNENEGYKFRVDRKVGDGEWVEKYKLFNSDVYTFVDSAAGIDQTNEYRVSVAFDDHLSKPLTRSVFNEFYAPAGLDLTNINLNTVQLRWSDNSNGEDGFKIDRYSIGEWAESFVILGENTEAWTDSTVIPNDSVQYKISAFRSGVYSAEVLSERVNTNIPAPTNFRHEFINISTIKLSWTDNSTGEEGFRIEKRVAIGQWEVVHTALEDSTSWTDLFAEVGEVLQYRISAFKGSQASALVYSEGFNNPFPPPSNLRLSQLDLNTIRLDWADNSLGEEGFKIDKRDSTGNWQYDIVSLGPNTESWIDTPTDIYDTLAYRIKAFKGTATSNTSEATISDITFPPPSGLIVTREGLTRLRFDWTDNSVGEDSFIIDKQIDSENWIISYGTVSADVVTWTDSLANVDHELRYRIYAKAGSNFSNYAVSEVIDNSIPAPSNLQYEKLTISSIRLTWTDNSMDEHGFIIDKFVNGAWDTDYAQVGRNSTQWTDISAEINRDIVYRIKAYYSTDYSDLCETGIINNTFPAPSNLTAQADGMDITLNWTDNSTGETGFIIDKKYDGGLWDDNYTTVASNIITWTETVADTGKYYYRVKAYSGTDLSVTSAVAEAWIQQTANEMILVPAGTFMMGQVGVAEPVHEVTISQSFYMAKYETTQKEWNDTMGTNPATGYGEGDNFPVYNVSWYDVIVYCNKKSIHDGLDPCYEINNSTEPNDWGTIPTTQDATWDAVECRWYENGYRLPTEAEWEYAARYNDGRTYPWGETAPDETYCNFNNNIGATTEVGSYSPKGDSQLGFSDMAGNVWEWVWDLVGVYQDTSQIDPTGSTTQSDYVYMRGGGWYNTDVLISYRNSQYKAGGSWGIGFRVARNNPADPRPVTFLKTFSSGGTDEAFSTIETQDGYLIAGCAWPVTTPMTTWIVKTNMHGAKLWEKVLYEGYCRSMIEAHDENAYLVLGYREESVGDLDIIITKIDDAGNELWCKAYNFSENDYGWGICKTNDGGYAIVGYKEKNLPSVNNDLLIFKIDGSGNQSWYKTYGGDGRDEGYSIKQLNNGDIVVVGRYDQGIDLGYKDVWMIKTDFEGNLIWDKKYDGSYSDSDSGRDVLPTLDGGYLITGSEGNKGGWIIKTDSTGNLEWDQNLGDFTESAMQKADGFFYITGIKESIDPYTDIVFIKIDSNGNRLFEKNYGREYEEQISDLKISSDNGFIITGSSANVTGKLDYILIKTDENGSVMGWK
ncbi:MAG: SUMF1/EgtB/PvdO family nonheme iron enzyme [Candidatus Delongbacteria bacterium]